jgi:hypothetical protein
MAKQFLCKLIGHDYDISIVEEVGGTLRVVAEQCTRCDHTTRSLRPEAIIQAIRPANDKYGRIHTDWSRSGGQPARGYGVVTAANYTSPIGGAGGLPCGVVGVATQSDALLEGDAQTILYLLGVRHGREDERAKIAAETRQSTQSDALREALEDLLHAVCGENGFVQAVRWDSGRIYPHPALDLAEAKARAALEQGK